VSITLNVWFDFSFWQLKQLMAKQEIRNKEMRVFIAGAFFYRLLLLKKV
jgi:hypothetical protein